MQKIAPYGSFPPEAFPQAEGLRDAGLRVIRWNQIDQLPEPNWLVEGLLGESGISVLYGDPKVGKSLMGLHLAAHVAAGRIWFGRKTNAGAVYYIAAEGLGTLRHRLKAIELHCGIDPVCIPLSLVLETLDLRSNQVDVDLLTDEICADGNAGLAKLIIVDTLNRCLSGGDENSSADMGAFIANCTRLRDATGAHVLIVHHAGKDKGRGMRGHSSLLGAVDTAIFLKRQQNKDFGSLEVTAQRDGPANLSIAFGLEPVMISQSDPDCPFSTLVVTACSDAQHEIPKFGTASASALKVLQDLLSGQIQSDQASAKQAVGESAWREACDEAVISKARKKEDRDRVFRSARDELVKANLIICEDGSVSLHS